MRGAPIAYGCDAGSIANGGGCACIGIGVGNFGASGGASTVAICDEFCSGQPSGGVAGAVGTWSVPGMGVLRRGSLVSNAYAAPGG